MQSRLDLNFSNCRTMNYGAGLTTLSLHLGARSGLGFGITIFFFPNRAITDSKGIHLLKCFCSCLGVMLS